MKEVPKIQIPLDDALFDQILPDQIRNLSFRHFTSLEVANTACKWLNEYKSLNVLDLGCGVGKFCVAAAFFTEHNITGTDFRNEYIIIAKSIKTKYELQNLNFINQNILDVQFENYNAFYFFNPFLEQIDDTARMDENYETSPLLYSIYENHVKQQLQVMTTGTIVITYFVTPQQIPSNYQIINESYDGLLKLWMKK